MLRETLAEVNAEVEITVYPVDLSEDGVVDIFRGFELAVKNGQ